MGKQTSPSKGNKKSVESSAMFSRNLNDVLGAIPLIVFTASPDGNITYVNNQFISYTGITLEVAKQRGLIPAIHPDMVERRTELWKQSMQTGNDFYFEPLLKRKSDASYRWHITRAVPIRNEDGEITDWIATSTDIHEQKIQSSLLEEMVEGRLRELQRTNSELQYLIQTHEHAEHSSFFGSYRYQFDTQGLTYSDNLYRILGCEPNEFPPSPENFAKFVHPDFKEYLAKATAEAFVNKHISKWEYKMIRKDGKTIWVRGTGKIITDDHNVQSMIGTLQDITSEKEREDEIITVNQSLKEKNLSLERMNRELESFAYISSHDLKEPLHKIQSFSTQILEKENSNLSDKGKDYFRRIRDAGSRMQTLIDDLLTYSRTNTEDLIFENTDLRHIVDQVKLDLKENIHEKGATIEIRSLGNANVFPFQFRQLMNNLINNSLKFSRTGVPPHIIISSEIVQGSKTKEPLLSLENTYCHISVSDNGIGFEPQFCGRIFEVFQRLHGREVYNGTGIGLAICKKIVENHNGIITATGELNKGATFDIYIPA